MKSRLYQPSWRQRLRYHQIRWLRYDPDTLLRRAVETIRAGDPISSTLWTDAVYGFGNEWWSADEGYLQVVISAAQATSGSIVECGSGLTTLLMAAACYRQGTVIHALEHNPDWYDRMREQLAALGLTNAQVHLTPLVPFGEYAWYDHTVCALPHDVTLVICDGPPAATPGGRSGMLPQLRPYFATSCTVLCDDATRPEDRATILAWGKSPGVQVDFGTPPEAYATLSVSAPT